MQEKKHIIIVDKSEIYRKALKEALVSVNSDVIIDAEFCNCSQISNYLSLNIVDFIFIEMNLDNKAIDFIDNFSKMYPKTKIIAMSNSEFDLMIKLAESKGAFAFMSKCRNNINLFNDILSAENNSFLINNELQ